MDVTTSNRQRRTRELHLARGIDAAAHEAALDAGGRAVAVLGHGLLRPVYPRENATLAEKVVRHGALVSQFRPDAPPTRYTFGMRNAVTSGLSQGTVVVEAGRTSGARMQARLAAEHGKRVWLLRSLVERFEWAQTFLDRHPHEARMVASVDDVMQDLRDARTIADAAGAGPADVPDLRETRRGADEPVQLALGTPRI